MPRPNASPGRTGRPPLTSRPQILAAARRIIDRDGWEKLTMRRLAAELGIGAPTLYHHVRDRDDLLVQLINEHADQTMAPHLPDDPQERVVAATIAIHDSLAAWPWAAEALTTDGFLGLLGASPLRMVETVLAGAVDCGCTRDQAVDVFRALWYYTVGEILVRAHTTQRRQEGSAPRPATYFVSLDPSAMPHLAAVGNRWPVLSARDIYAEALRGIVAGLLGQARSGAGASAERGN